MNHSTRQRDERRHEDQNRRHAGRVYWRGLDEFLFVEQVQAISFVQICVLCRRITTGRVLTSAVRALRKKRNEDEVHDASERDFVIQI